MKVYLASRYDRREEMKEHRKVLESHGITVTSTWLDEKGSPTSDLGDESEVFYIEHAVKDLVDLEAADAIVFFSENPLEGFKRGARHVEFGYALRADKKMYVVGKYKENIFHYLGYIERFDTLEDLIKGKGWDKKKLEKAKDMN